MRNVFNLKILFLVVFGLIFSTNLNANTMLSKSYEEESNVENTIVRFVCGRCGSVNLKYYGYFENNDFTIFYVKRIVCKDCGKVTRLPSVTPIIVTSDMDINAD